MHLSVLSNCKKLAAVSLLFFFLHHKRTSDPYFFFQEKLNCCNVQSRIIACILTCTSTIWPMGNSHKCLGCRECNPNLLTSGAGVRVNLPSSCATRIRIRCLRNVADDQYSYHSQMLSMGNDIQFMYTFSPFSSHFGFALGWLTIFMKGLQNVRLTIQLVWVLEMAQDCLLEQSILGSSLDVFVVRIALALEVRCMQILEIHVSLLKVVVACDSVDLSLHSWLTSG